MGRWVGEGRGKKEEKGDVTEMTNQVKEWASMQWPKWVYVQSNNEAIWIQFWLWHNSKHLNSVISALVYRK